MAAKVLSALATAYMEKHLEVHRSTGEFKFFDQQMRQYQQGLDQAQAKLTEFHQKHRRSLGRPGTGCCIAASQMNSMPLRARLGRALLETQQRVADPAESAAVP